MKQSRAPLQPSVKCSDVYLSVSAGITFPSLSHEMRTKAPSLAAVVATMQLKTTDPSWSTDVFIGLTTKVIRAATTTGKKQWQIKLQARVHPLSYQNIAWHKYCDGVEADTGVTVFRTTHPTALKAGERRGYTNETCSRMGVSLIYI